MKEKKEIICKATKNRFTGRTDSWLMGVDYEHMRYFDIIPTDSADAVSASEELKRLQSESGINEDFTSGYTSSSINQKLKDAEEFVDKSIADIRKQDIQIIKEKDKDPFKSDLDELYKDLGI